MTAADTSRCRGAGRGTAFTEAEVCVDLSGCGAGPGQEHRGAVAPLLLQHAVHVRAAGRGGALAGAVAAADRENRVCSQQRSIVRVGNSHKPKPTVAALTRHRVAVVLALLRAAFAVRGDDDSLDALGAGGARDRIAAVAVQSVVACRVVAELILVGLGALRALEGRLVEHCPRALHAMKVVHTPRVIAEELERVVAADGHGVRLSRGLRAEGLVLLEAALAALVQGVGACAALVAAALRRGSAARSELGDAGRVLTEVLDFNLGAAGRVHLRLVDARAARAGEEAVVARVVAVLLQRELAVLPGLARRGAEGGALARGAAQVWVLLEALVALGAG